MTTGTSWLDNIQQHRVTGYTHPVLPATPTTPTEPRSRPNAWRNHWIHLDMTPTAARAVCSCCWSSRWHVNTADAVNVGAAHTAARRRVTG